MELPPYCFKWLNQEQKPLENPFNKVTLSVFLCDLSKLETVGNRIDKKNITKLALVAVPIDLP
jgi:hypothetical protein